MSPEPSSRNTPVWMTAALLIVALAVGAVSVLYFAKSAADLPSFFPGHTAGHTHHHIKHGIAATLVALALVAGAWLSSGQKKPQA